MITGLEQNLKKIRNTAAAIATLLTKGLTIEEVAKKLNVSEEEVGEIEEIVEQINNN